PVEGARVVSARSDTPLLYAARDDSAPLFTGADGRFSVAFPESEEAQAGPGAEKPATVIHVLAPGFAAARSGPIPEEAPPQRIVLSAGVELSGQVTTTDGRALAGVGIV